jgi:hypothetical protein
VSSVQEAYDTAAPNGSARRRAGDPITSVFRLYRVRPAANLRSLPNGANVVRQAIRSVRESIRSIQDRIAPTSGPLRGRTLAAEFRFDLILEEFFESPEVRTHFTYVRGGPPGENYFISTPFANAKGVTHFRLRGRTHWAPVLVNGVQQDGDAAIKQFKELIDDYFFPADGSPPADYELYWSNLNAPISAGDPLGEFEWLIHPTRNGVQIQQSAHRPFQRFFSFDFLGLRSNRDLAKAEDGFLAGLASGGYLRRLFDLLHIGELSDILDEIFGTVEEFHALLDDVNNIASTVLDYINGVEQFIVASFGLVRGTLSRIQALIGEVEEGIALLGDIPDLVEDQLRLVRQSFPGLSSGNAQPAVEARDQLRNVRDFLLALAAQPRLFQPPVSATGIGQSIAVNLQPAVTLEQIAAAGNVTPAEIIDTNGLLYPFFDPRVRTEKIQEQAQIAVNLASIPTDDPLTTFKSLTDSAARAYAWAITQGVLLDEDQLLVFAEADQVGRAIYARVRQAGTGAASATEIATLQAAATEAATIVLMYPSEPRVIYAGDPVRIPQPSPDRVPSIVGIEGNFVAASGRQVTEEERLFGIDIYLNNAGNLEWDETQLDLRLSRGLENIALAQVRYIRLPLGQLRFAPGIGNFAWEDLSSWQGPGQNQLLVYSIARSLSQDPRVRVVSNIRSTVFKGVATLLYNAVLINGKDVPELRAPLA